MVKIKPGKLHQNPKVSNSLKLKLAKIQLHTIFTQC